MALSNRTFCYLASTHLAETGAEEALWALNQARNTSGYSWSGWTISGSTASKVLSGVAVTDRASATVTIQIANYATDNPVVTTHGITRMTDGIPIDKQLQFTAKPAALFANAVGATTSASFTISYTDTIDSYDSSVSIDPTSALQTSRDQAIVSAPTVAVNSAAILGYVAISSSSPTFTNSTSGSVKGSFTSPSVLRDPSRIYSGASQSTFDISAPSGGTLLFSGSSTGTAAIGTAGATTPSVYYDGPYGIALSGSDKLTINGPVIIVVSHNLSISNSASIVVSSSGSAQIIVAGAIDISGGGIVNQTSLPAKLLVAGTSSSAYGFSSGTYTARLATSAPFYGALYVPSGSLQLYGTTTLYGSAVAKTVDRGWGNGVLHYDLNLRKVAFSTLSTPSDIESWSVE